MINYDYIDKNGINIVIGLFVVALIFIIIGHCYREQIQEVLKREIVQFPNCSLDWWSVSHFVLFMLCGFIIPGRPLTFFSIGVGFELFEDYLASNDSTQLASCVGEGMNKIWCNGYQDGYWYCNPTDPWVNLTGYIIGSAIRTM